MNNKKIISFSSSFLILLIISLISKQIAFLPFFNIIGHLVIALILGMLLQISPKIHEIVKTNTSFISNKFLRLGIILIGFKLNLVLLAQNGIKTLGLAILVIAFTVSSIYALAIKSFKIKKPLALLSASGCGICGAAAVLGVSPVIGTDEDDEVISVAIVAILGTLFTLVLVFVRNILPINNIQYGVWAGLSLHEIAHSVAAGNAGGEISLNIATIVKLSRVLMLAPYSILLAFILKNNNKTDNKNFKIPIPYFMFGFILSSAIGTYSNLTQFQLNFLVDLGYILLGTAMAALGSNVNFKLILKKGQKMFLVALICSALLSILSYLLAKLFF